MSDVSTSSNDAMAQRRDVFVGQDGPGDDFVGDAIAIHVKVALCIWKVQRIGQF